MTELPRERNRSRDFDIVVFGATGFTGRLVAEYLLRTQGEGDLRVALAGRSQSKLERVREELGALVPAGKGWPVLVGDSFDSASLDAIASRTSVVCSTVGPFAKYGAELVASCVRHGTDYCDITGETHFIRRTIDAHHDEARRTGARIVHSCGYDSIPSDLGTLMIQDAMQRRHGVSAHEVKVFAGETDGAFSGGTAASILNLLDEAKNDRSLRRILGDPYGLNPEGMREGPDGPDQRGVAFDPDLGMWTAPFLMAGINTRVVRRSHALLGRPWGKDFRYSEAMSTGRGAKGLAMASAVVGGLTGFMLAAVNPLTRGMVEKRLPSPGEGPSKEKRERGFFRTRVLAKAEVDGRPVLLRGLVEGQQDPGYGETAKMLGESALCLALDGAELECEGGILTPASSMGMRLVERLRAAGMTFRVEE